MSSELLFFIVILLANIVQGITGFAGTILAMPVSLMLVGYDVAKPVLNVLGLLSGVYVFAGQHKAVNWKEVLRICLVMAVGILCGIFLKSLLEGQEQILYILLGIFVILLAIEGLYRQIHQKNSAADQKQEAAASKITTTPASSEEQRVGEKDQAGDSGSSVQVKNPSNPGVGSYALLGLAGVVHGIFVSGGPLVISYLSKRISDKTSFRATISTVWIVLNSIILCDDIRSGLWDLALVQTLLIAIPFLLVGMFLGSILYKKMSQHVFMILTYVLLLISGVLLFIK